MIAAVTQRNESFEVWDENGNFLFQVLGDELMGYTSTTVSVLRGGVIDVYDDHGNFKFNRFT